MNIYIYTLYIIHLIYIYKTHVYSIMFSLYTQSIHESSHPTFNLAFQALIFSSAASSASIASRRAFSSSIQHHLRSPKSLFGKDNDGKHLENP